MPGARAALTWRSRRLREETMVCNNLLVEKGAHDAAVLRLKAEIVLGLSI